MSVPDITLSSFYPKDDSIFVVGCSNKKVIVYDTISVEITQEYNHHLAPVNTITFAEDQGMKMITSSDDKKVLVWEWDIGVPIKYISDPTMHSMPVMTLHPTGNYIAGQSLDNHIAVYQGRDRFAIQRNKKGLGRKTLFLGMEKVQVSSFCCKSKELVFAIADSRFAFIYCHKMLQKYRAHEKGPTIGCVWHPVLPSTVFSCGWDTVIKMWQLEMRLVIQEMRVRLQKAMIIISLIS